jgi:hypothetical protein
MKMYLLSFFFCSISFAQSSISGTVTDSDVQPILNIKVVGTAGTVTDSEGKFSLNSPSKLPYVIEISSIG